MFGVEKEGAETPKEKQEISFRAVDPLFRTRGWKGFQRTADVARKEPEEKRPSTYSITTSQEEMVVVVDLSLL